MYQLTIWKTLAVAVVLCFMLGFTLYTTQRMTDERRAQERERALPVCTKSDSFQNFLQSRNGGGSRAQIKCRVP